MILDDLERPKRHSCQTPVLDLPTPEGWKAELTYRNSVPPTLIVESPINTMQPNGLEVGMQYTPIASNYGELRTSRNHDIGAY